MEPISSHRSTRTGLLRVGRVAASLAMFLSHRGNDLTAIGREASFGMVHAHDVFNRCIESPAQPSSKGGPWLRGMTSMELRKNCMARSVPVDHRLSKVASPVKTLKWPRARSHHH